jgi:hypothetical protein
LLKVEGLAEYSSLVSTTRVDWAQAVILDLADIKGRLSAER